MAHNPYPRAVTGSPTTVHAMGGLPSWVGDRPPQVRAHLEVAGPATGETAARARRQFSTWLAVDLAAGDLFDDLILVVYEALANAADHAYLATDIGPVTLLAQRTAGTVHITVTDHGIWRPPAPATLAARRGRGLPLIHRLIPDVHVEHPTAGTTVHLRAPLPAHTTEPG